MHRIREKIEWVEMYEKIVDKCGVLKLMIGMKAGLHQLNQNGSQPNQQQFQTDRILSRLIEQDESQIDYQLIEILASKNITGDKGYPNTTPLELAMLSSKHKLVRLFITNNAGHNIHQQVLLDYLHNLYLSLQTSSSLPSDLTFNFYFLLFLHPNLKWNLLIFYLKNHSPSTANNHPYLLHFDDHLTPSLIHIFNLQMDKQVNTITILD